MDRMTEMLRFGADILDEWETYCDENDLPKAETNYIAPLFHLERKDGQNIWIVDRFAVYCPVDVPISGMKNLTEEIEYFKNFWLGPLYNGVSVEILYNVVNDEKVE